MGLRQILSIESQIMLVTSASIKNNTIIPLIYFQSVERPTHIWREHFELDLILIQSSGKPGDYKSNVIENSNFSKI